jgi:hypothetical protein
MKAIEIINIYFNYNKLKAENARLREALEPFAKTYLWPDDSGYADELRADEDWSEVGNDGYLDSCLIQRKWIRDAREALKEKE